VDDAPQYPLVVLEKDDGSVFLFESYGELTGGTLEWIDVENDEYRAWDARARPLRLTVVPPPPLLGPGFLQPLRDAVNRILLPMPAPGVAWLAVSVASHIPDPAASRAVASYLRLLGVEPTGDTLEHLVALLRVALPHPGRRS
jgi:hypothetical protein